MDSVPALTKSQLKVPPTVTAIVTSPRCLGWGRLFRDSKGDLAHRARTDGGGGGAYVCVVRGLSRDAGDGWEPICARETECACKVNKTTDNPNYTATTTILRYMCISCICLRWLTTNTSEY